MAPGDAVEILAGESGAANPEYMDNLREKFGLDKPLYVQLGNYLWNLVQLDLGYSFRHNMGVAELIMDRVPATLLLMGATITLSTLLGIVFGVLAAKNAFRL
ncbi:MAG: ABC transporter permease, partial [Proteobacteria bacterium]